MMEWEEKPTSAKVRIWVRISDELRDRVGWFRVVGGQEVGAIKCGPIAHAILTPPSALSNTYGVTV
jgi:hypothetical protein